jgi:Protein of unknown function (DUF3800)
MASRSSGRVAASVGGSPAVYVDESGNTGENLTDPEQPVFVLAAVQLSDNDAARLATAVAGRSGRGPLQCSAEALGRAEQAHRTPDGPGPETQRECAGGRVPQAIHDCSQACGPAH